MNAWENTEWNDGVNNLQQVGNGGFAFSFPTDPKHVNDIRLKRGPVQVGGVISMRYRIINPNPKVKAVFVNADPVKGGIPPDFRPMLETGDLEGRYYPSGIQCGYLIPGKAASLNIPLLAKYWQDVNGKPADESGFKNTCDHLWAVSIVFGMVSKEEVGFAHGVGLQSGQLSFHLLNFSISRSGK